MANPTEASLSILLVGGTGYVSGHLARVALAAGHDVTIVTRGQRAAPDGVKSIVADRNDAEGFARAIRATDQRWDLVVDCVGYEPRHARQDLDVFAGRTEHLVFISTDMVFDPARCIVPTPPEHPHYQTSSNYGGLKRQCELAFLESGRSRFTWSIVRPCHIYGPGWWLGCMPLHFRDERLLDVIRQGETLRLVGGGHFLQHPVFAPDLARMILSCARNPSAVGKTYMAAGPDIIESRRYYEIVAEFLGCALNVEEIPIAPYIRKHPEHGPQLRHRIYDMSDARVDGLAVPSTPIVEGLIEHAQSLLVR